jgi:flagellar motor switch/type III secretory pathway protein FliN
MPFSNENDDNEFSDDAEDFEPLEEESEGVLEEGEEEIHPHKHHEKPVALEEIGLDCKIELGSISVPYETLANLTYESTLKIDLDPKQVFLTLNGQILRRGEIVAFDQQLFFKVLE